MIERTGLPVCVALLAALLAVAGCSSEPPGATTTPAASTIQRGNLRFVDNYAVGVERAAAEGKPLLLFFTARWCRFCHELAEESFTNEQVVALSERFVCVLVDADASPEVCEQYHVRSYPTIQFLSPTGAPLHRVTGKRPGQQLALEMQSALHATARRYGLPANAVQ